MGQFHGDSEGDSRGITAPSSGRRVLRAASKALEPICAPKGIGPSAAGHFSCKAATSKGAAMGAMGADHGPPQSCRRLRLCGSWERRPCPRCGSTCFGREKADEAMAAPKGHGPLDSAGFSPAADVFRGSPDGAMIVLVDP
jgi:hypothetical protein